MFLVYTEQDGFRPRVRVLQEFCEMSCNDFVANLHGNHPLEVRSTIELVGDLPLVPIYFSSRWSPAFRVNRGENAMDPIWGEETVIDALPETVSINWVSEIPVGNLVLFAKSSCCHAQLESWFEVV